MRQDVNNPVNKRVGLIIARNHILLAVAFFIFATATGCNPASSKPTTSTPGISSNTDMLEVVYFHRPQRCSGCVYAETATRYTLENYFAEELENGKMVFKVINLGDRANEAIVKRYNAYTSSLFINSIRDGTDHVEEVKEIWFLLGRDSEFVALVKSKIDVYLNGEHL
ncbi:MAG: hypothetical protein JSW16_06195 [Dehalococcoidales bacterium]|nr:MAG: hypothetical protein JSW16_06195 [Dehalococcoidales bacterium]